MKKVISILTVLIILTSILTVFTIPAYAVNPNATISNPERKQSRESDRKLYEAFLSEHPEYKYGAYISLTGYDDQLVVSYSELNDYFDDCVYLCTISEDKKHVDTYLINSHYDRMHFDPNLRALIGTGGGTDLLAFSLLTYEKQQVYEWSINRQYRYFSKEEGGEWRFEYSKTRWNAIPNTDWELFEQRDEPTRRTEYISEEEFNRYEKYFKSLPALDLPLITEGRVPEITYTYDNNSVQLQMENPPTAPALQRKSKRIAAGGRHTAYLWPEGTVSVIGNNQDGQQKTDTWSEVVDVYTGIYTSFGLRRDGTVYATGNNKYGQCNTSAWVDIVDIDSANYHTLGLKKDGTVVATGFNYHGQCDVGRWKNIKQIATGEYFSVGLKSNGTVLATGENLYGQCDTEDWENIAAIDAGYWHTVGLLNNRKVIATGRNNFGQCNVSGWADVQQISAGFDHTVALLSDGTVVAVGNNSYGQCNVQGWTDMVYVSAGMYFTVGIKANGRIVATGSNQYGQCNVNKFNA